MTYVAYAYGRGSSVVGAVAAYGLGINPLAPVVNASILFGANLDFSYINQLFANSSIVISAELDMNALNTRLVEAGISLDTNLDLDILNQLFSNPNISFDTNLDQTILNRLLAEKASSFDLELTLDYSVFRNLENIRHNIIHVIPEEIRLLPIFKELRECIVISDIRTEVINYEDRMVIVLPKIGE